MLTSLMSMFDPSMVLVTGLPIKWLGVILICLYAGGEFWLVNSGYRSFITSGCLLLHELHFIPFLGIVSFYYVLSMNFISLIPFMLPFTSHISVNLGLALTFWLSGLLYSFGNSLKEALAHYLPLGSPMVLGPLLVSIEVVSVLIRPVSLSVRLMANILGGHIIMGLIEESSFGSLTSGILTMPMYTFMVCVELFVAVVQAYVLSKLLSIYWEQ
nr:ATP synthase 6 [Pthirus gorillae]